LNHALQEKDVHLHLAPLGVRNDSFGTSVQLRLTGKQGVLDFYISGARVPIGEIEFNYFN
jgi:hypothetical protein